MYESMALLFNSKIIFYEKKNKIHEPLKDYSLPLSTTTKDLAPSK